MTTSIQSQSNALPAIGDTVRFNYFRDPVFRYEEYTGEITDRKFDRLCGWMYRIAPSKDDAKATAMGLTPRYVAGFHIREIITTAKPAGQTEEALYNEQLRLMKLVSPAYMAWETALINRESRETVARLNAAHIAAEDAYNRARRAYLQFRPTAPQTPHTGIPAAVDDVQVFSGALEQKSPENASEPFAPINAKNDHPLALIEPGAIHDEAYWDAQKAKRDAQHAEAKARVEALNGAYQAPVRTGIQMHSREYLNQVFKQAAGGAK